MTGISRRDFIVSSAVGVGFATRAPAVAPAEWFDRPMRWAQLTLVENDPGRYDPQFMTAVHREIASHYAVDGIFGNRWS